MEGFKAHYHLPGLFEHLDFYKVFIPLYEAHPEYFYDWCDIASVYGAPENCIWGGGRVEESDTSPEEVKCFFEVHEIPIRLTLSNSLLKEEDLKDKACNKLCKIFNDSNKKTGIIIHSETLLEYLKKSYPNFYFISSTTKVLTKFSDFKTELDREDFTCVVPDFRLNKDLDDLKLLSEEEKDKTEFLCNECCSIRCKMRKECYENVSRIALGEEPLDYKCSSPEGKNGYSFSEAMKNPSFISREDIRNTYMPMGFSNFKIEGRGLGSAILLEFILYYMVKPECQLKVREGLYLDSMLDLF